jgi:hypothetical protein
MWAYDQSKARYPAIRLQLDEPDGFKMKYREVIKKPITEIIIQAFDLKLTLKKKKKLQTNYLLRIRENLLKLLKKNYLSSMKVILRSI